MFTPALAAAKPPIAPDPEARRNLLLSFPELDVAHDGRDVIDSLVEGVICHLLTEHGVAKMLVLHDVAAALRDLAGLTYEPAELVSAFERLQRRHRLSFRDESHRSFVYDEKAYRATAEAFQVRMAAWNAVREAWMDEVRLSHGLDEEQASALWEALDEFATRLINAYSAEAAAFLYLNDAKGQTRFYEALQARLPEVAETVAPDLLVVATHEFPRFFDHTSPARTDYLTGRLRASFFFHLLSVDPTASQLVREQVQEKVLYLDSNFVFRLIGFHGPALAFTPLTAVQVSKQLKCRLLVARETVDEIVRVIKANVVHLKAVPITREAYLRVAARHPSDEGEFMAAYYHELQSGRVRSPEEFGRKWSNVRAFLKEWDIEVDEEAYADDQERTSDEFIDEMSRLQRWHSGLKNPTAVEHDVAMLRLIRQLRGRVDATSASVRVWFLTFDRQLTRYSAYYATEAHLPAALLADDWLQIARPFLPRTDDYAKSFVAMLHNPMLYQGSSEVPFSHMAEALSRLERYEELPEQVVAAMVADDQFTRSFLEAETEAEERRLIELTAGRVAADAITKSKSLQEQLAQVQQQVATLAENLDSVRDARDAATRERDRAQEEARSARDNEALQLERLRREFDAKLELTVQRARADAAADTTSELQRQTASEVNKARRKTAYLCLAGTATLAGLALVLTRWGAWTAMQVTIALAGVALVDLALLWILNGVYRTLSLLASLFTVLGGLALGYQWWQANSPRPQSGAHPVQRHLERADSMRADSAPHDAAVKASDTSQSSAENNRSRAGTR
jgi:hypothetical protein